MKEMKYVPITNSSMGMNATTMRCIRVDGSDLSMSQVQQIVELLDRFREIARTAPPE
jgi:hypothetical protein